MDIIIPAKLRALADELIESADVCFWHKEDIQIQIVLSDVRLWG
jgi:hypothetical protein